MGVKVSLQEGVEGHPAPRSGTAACALWWVLVLPCMAFTAAC